jgi:protein-S-isoprenylcysteine O-methyltransferase Ste14
LRDGDGHETSVTSKDHPGVIAPPPFIFLGFLLAALAADRLLLRVPTGLPSEFRIVAGVLLAGVAGALLVTALRGFRRSGTNPEPWRPSTAIVTTGIYRFTRNPMYLGMTLAYLALALALDSGVALVLLAPLLATVQVGVIQREERYLEAKFGESYRAYLSQVRRWL